MPRTKIVVTGSSGFIGKNLMDKLPRVMPSAEIVTLLRSGANRSDGVVADYGDAASLMRIQALREANYVIHLAGITRGIREREFREGIIVPTKNLLEALCRTNKNLRRFVFASSHAAAGPSRCLEHFKQEDEKPCPIESYGKCKLDAEYLIQSYGYSIPFTILKLGAVYGPHDVDFLNIYKMLRFRVNIYPGYRNNYVSYVFVSDAVQAIILSMLSDRAQNQVYFICNDHPAQWKDIHEAVIRSAQVKAVSVNLPYKVVLGLSYLGVIPALCLRRVPILNPQKLRLSSSPYWIASNLKAKQELGFSPFYSLEEGIQITYDWYKKMRLI